MDTPTCWLIFDADRTLILSIVARSSWFRKSKFPNDIPMHRANPDPTGRIRHLRLFSHALHLFLPDLTPIFPVPTSFLGTAVLGVEVDE